MDAVMEKLSEIEEAARAIVEQAQEEKKAIEKEIQERRDTLSRELGEKTKNKIAAIRKEGDEKMQMLLDGQKLRNSAAIENLEEEFAKNHTAYAEEILRCIIEV